MNTLTVIVSAPGVDGVASAVIAARACDGPFEALFFESGRLVDFFDASVQDKLPSLYTLLLCDLQVIHTNWDGELVRPRLLDALRASVLPTRWFSAHTWLPEDRAVVQNILGEGRLFVSGQAPCTAALVRDHFAGLDQEYSELMVRFACGRLHETAMAQWGTDWRRVVAFLRGETLRLAEAIRPLIDGTPDLLGRDLKQAAARAEVENRETAARNADEPVPVGEHKLVVVAVPGERHAFWREISDCARARSGAEFCLCRLAGRPMLVLTRGPEQRVDLRPWARYLTDLMPGARALDEQPDAVPILVGGLDRDPGLKGEAIRILQEGAHLLAG